MKNESDSMDYSKLEKQLHDDFQHMDEEELNGHLKAAKKDSKYTSGNKKLDKSLSKLMIFRR